MALEETLTEMQKILEGILVENKDISDEEWWKELYELNKRLINVLKLLK